MSYGLYDGDLKLYPTPFYNLELMKLASYYKNKREIVGLSLDFSPQKYTHFIVRQDFYANQTYPLNFHNVEYGGRAFGGDVYQPLPLEIEMMRPDISIYNRAIPKRIKKRQKTIFSTMRRAEHLRLSLDGKTIWSDFEKQLRKDSDCFGIIFHDYDLGAIDGSFELVKELIPATIAHKDGRKIGMKFPIQISQENELIKWLSLQPMGTYYSLCYNNLIDFNLVPALIEVKQQSYAYRQMSMNINNELQKPNPIDKNIHHIYRSLINLRTQRLIFPLIYDNSIFTDDNWKQVMQLINRYNTHLVSQSTRSDYFSRIEPFETLYSYVKAVQRQPAIKDSILSLESVRNIFQFVRENNYDLFKDFYEYRGEEVRK